VVGRPQAAQPRAAAATKGAPDRVIMRSVTAGNVRSRDDQRNTTCFPSAARASEQPVAGAHLVPIYDRFAAHKRQRHAALSRAVEHAFATARRKRCNAADVAWQPRTSHRYATAAPRGAFPQPFRVVDTRHACRGYGENTATNDEPDDRRLQAGSVERPNRRVEERDSPVSPLADAGCTWAGTREGARYFPLLHGR
jgi:hypothetical protein